MKLLFWNIQKKKSCFKVIADAVQDEDIDVVALAEFSSDFGATEELLTLLKQVGEGYKRLISPVPEKVIIFYNSNKVTVKNRYNEGKIAIKKISSFVSETNAYIVFCHFMSKVSVSNAEQSERITNVKNIIDSFEKENDDEHGILLLCGDLNMNPFEEGVIKANGLNAVMESSIAQKKCRKVGGGKYKYFYNPMWGFLGDLGKDRVSGTYFHNPSNHIQYFWNIFDQVLLCPEAIPYFDKEALHIISETTNFKLLKPSGIIDKNNYSDHLPIMFKLNI